MNIGTINLATLRLSKSSSSHAADTRVFLMDDSRIVADVELKFKLLTLTQKYAELLNLKSDRFIETQFDKLKSRLNELGIEFDPSIDPFPSMVEKKAMIAGEVVTNVGPNAKSIEVALLPELIMTVAKYEFFKKLRYTHPEKFVQPEADMTAYAKHHRLALRLTSNAILTDEQREERKKGKLKREANFDLLKKFTSDPESIVY
ncbi:MAG TPA: hypothetical protein DGG95_07300 [Cytophagales bacterium]|jgi:hypothetical protein|nr:hypothetical protein [Cytophagales bacterium]